MGCYPQLFVTVSGQCPTAGVLLLPCAILLSGEAAEVPAQQGRLSWVCSGTVASLVPVPCAQQSAEIASYLGSICHALLNCFVLTRCQEWIVTLTQPQPGWGWQACAVGLISLQAEGRLPSSWVCRDL